MLKDVNKHCQRIISGVCSNCLLFIQVIQLVDRQLCKVVHILVSGIGAVVKAVDSHFCGWVSISGKVCSFLIVSLSKGLSLYFMCSDQHVKYWMPRGFHLSSSLLLDYHIKTIHTHIHTYIHISQSYSKLTLASQKYTSSGIYNFVISKSFV